MKQRAEREGITETLKTDNQMEWVQRMNALRLAVTETVNAEAVSYTHLDVYKRQIRDKLDAVKIPYKYKVKNRLGQWVGRGTLRGNMGSFGTPSDQMYQYEILVYRKDLDKARYILGRS